MPGVAKPQVLGDDQLQNPKPIDPGHVAQLSAGPSRAS